jgi:hypothetical protein
MAQLNAAVYGADECLSAVCDDVRGVALEQLEAVFIDPARRAGGDRVRLSSGASEPPLDWCLDLVGRVGAVAVKAAPGLPHDLIPEAWEAEFVSDARALKECTLWSPALATATRRATLLDRDLTLSSHAPSEAVPVSPPGQYLLDPDPAVTRASLVEALAHSLGADVWKIDADIAFLSSAREVHTPFARTLAVDASLPWNLKRLREALRARQIGVVDIRKRGSAVDVDELRTRLRLHGDGSAIVVLTRVLGRPWSLLCRPV